LSAIIKVVLDWSKTAVIFFISSGTSAACLRTQPCSGFRCLAPSRGRRRCARRRVHSGCKTKAAENADRHCRAEPGMVRPPGSSWSAVYAVAGEGRQAYFGCAYFWRLSLSALAIGSLHGFGNSMVNPLDEMMSAGQRMSHASGTHDFKGSAIGQRPVFIVPRIEKRVPLFRRGLRNAE